MPTILIDMLRRLLGGLKRALKSTRFGRNLLSDLSNREEFSNLLEHERMLADRIRVDSYYEAIKRQVNPDDVVVDLGTGSGILAMLAARHARQVYAIDHSDFIQVARRAVQHNGLDNVRVVQTNSRDFEPGEKVDLILHEQMGDELFTENMLENLLDLKRRLLKPGGRILPARFELYLEPAQLQPGRELPFIWERPLHGIDFGFMQQQSVFKPPLDYARPWLEVGAVDSLLGQPAPALALDLNAIDSPAAVVKRASLSRRVLRDAWLDGYVLYFRAIFDDSLSLDTSPLAPLTHWRWRLFRLPRRSCQAGELLRYELTLDDLADSSTWAVREVPAPTVVAAPAGLSAG